MHGTTLTDIFGIGEIGAATIIAAVGDVHRFPTRGHLAAYCGIAPLEASSGDIHRHRLSRKGNRQLTAVLHIAAVSRIRWDTPGRATHPGPGRGGLASGVRPCADGCAAEARWPDAVWCAGTLLRW